MYGIDATEKDESYFEIGDWVHVINHNAQGYVGYITGYDRIERDYTVRLTKKPSGKKVGYTVHVCADPEQLVLAGMEKGAFDLRPLIDQALDSGDKDLFMWLTSLK